MSAGATLVGALAVTLAHPSTWLLGLAAFLVRGGVVLFVVPIVAIPTPAGLADLFGSTIVSFVFGGVDLRLALLIGAIVLGFLVWILGGGRLAASLEAELIRIVAADTALGQGPVTEADPADGATPGPGPDHARDPAATILLARLLSLLPIAAASTWGAARVVTVTYAELTLPRDLSTPLVVRVIQDAPDALLVILLALVFGETIGGVAARRIALDGAPAGRALAWAVIDIVRRPLTTILLAAIPGLILAALGVGIAIATSAAWDGLRAALSDGGPAATVGLALAWFVGAYVVGLVLTGVVCGWRHAVWTVDQVRHRGGTFGWSGDGRPGHWNRHRSSGTL